MKRMINELEFCVYTKERFKIQNYFDRKYWIIF